ncbi:MAG: transcription termination factor Rho, partial [Pseudonocardiales bacterium]|nr:transcription termination factor Rho [Pseudonocardiales bacterium]
MSETDLVSTGAAPRKRGGLTGMVLAELRQLAGELNIPDTTGMRKGDLIAAIKERQGGGAAPSAPAQSQLTLPENGKAEKRAEPAASPASEPVTSADGAPVVTT